MLFPPADRWSLAQSLLILPTMTLSSASPPHKTAKQPKLDITITKNKIANPTTFFYLVMGLLVVVTDEPASGG